MQCYYEVLKKDLTSKQKDQFGMIKADIIEIKIAKDLWRSTISLISGFRFVF